MEGTNIFTYAFAVIFGIFILTAGSIPAVTTNQTSGVSSATVAHAQEDTTYTFMQNINLPGFGGEDGEVNVSEQSLAEFVNTLIQIAIGFAILLAVIMVIAAGAEYMLSGSVANKTEAQERIGKAVGGLFLALAAVAILQTINPNLVELNALDEQEFEGSEIVTPDFSEMGVTFNPDDAGLYYCFAHDSWGGNDYACAASQNQCEDAKEVDNNSYSACRQVVYYEGAYADENISSANSCYVYDNGGDPATRYEVNCYESTSECSNNASNNPGPGNVEVSCQPPGDFGDSGGGGEVLGNQLLEQYVLTSDSVAGSGSETEVRQRFKNATPTVYTNRGGESDPTDGTYCESVTDTACTNVGGSPMDAVSALINFNQNFSGSSQCSANTCSVEVTGGTSWWFHGEGNNNPNENGTTYHNPVGIDQPTGAFDLALGDNINSFINSKFSTPLGVGQSRCSGGHEFRRENDHWHVVFNKPSC